MLTAALRTATARGQLRPGLCRALSASAGPSPDASPYDLAAALRSAGKSRAWIRHDPATNTVVGSHPVLDPLVDFCANDEVDWHGHEGLFFEVGKDTGALMGAFTWWSMRGQPCGGIRLRPYDTLEDYLRDGMRLAIGMGRKSALAGLWWGGGKGAIVQDPSADVQDPAYREKLMADYGRFITNLRGCYVAAEDSGLCVEDMDLVYGGSRFTTCISPELGGSGNPSVPTAAGVIAAMEAALEFRGMGNLEGKRYVGRVDGALRCVLVCVLMCSVCGVRCAMCGVMCAVYSVRWWCTMCCVLYADVLMC